MEKLFSVLTVLLFSVVACTSQPAATATPVAPTSAAEVAATPTPVPPTNTVPPEPTPTPVPPTSAPTATFAAPTPSHTVEVTKDVEYVKLLAPGAPAQTLDVYAPTGPGPWPVIVLNHAWYQTKDAVVYSGLAKELAGRGFVVFAPSRRSDLATLFEGAEDNGRVFREVQESWACAYRFAREKAADYGGDADQLTVFSHGTSGLQTLFMGDDLQQTWEEFASQHGGPPPQTECLVDGGTAQVDRFVGYAGEFEWYEELQDKHPELWELTSLLHLSDRDPNLRLHLVFGEMGNPANIEQAIEYRQALVDAGYDATLTTLPDEKFQIPFRGPGREALIQIILEEAYR
jgi:hypothetical protein